MRKPSQHSIDLYNQLVERQNQIRKTLTRIHKRAEETFGAGRLPALVIPKKARKILMYQMRNTMAIKRFWASYSEAKALFGRGLRGYLARTVKDGYMELWRDQILFNSGESPEGVASRFTREQIENSYMGDFMEVYNKLVSLSPEAFLTMLYTGKIIQFKYIYEDIVLGTGSKENSWLQQQKELLSLSRKDIKDYMEWFSEYSRDTKKQSFASDLEEYEEETRAYSYTGRHKKETKEKAIKSIGKK